MRVMNRIYIYRLHSLQYTQIKNFERKYVIMNCPDCKSENINKNGSDSSGKQKFMCKACGRQFVENPEYRKISQVTKDLVEDLLLEKIPLAGIVRIVKISKRWLQYYVNGKYEDVPKK